MEFSINITVEIDQSANALDVRTPVTLQLIHKDGQWRAKCDHPPLETISFGTMEGALTAGAKEAALELQDNQPHIAGKITPNCNSTTTLTIQL